MIKLKIESDNGSGIETSFSSVGESVPTNLRNCIESYFFCDCVQANVINLSVYALREIVALLNDSIELFLGMSAPQEEFDTVVLAHRIVISRSK
jgi:hypothetical protein